MAKRGRKKILTDEQIKLNKKLWKNNNKEKCRGYRKKWRIAHPDYTRKYSCRKEKRKEDRKEILQELISKHGAICWYCGLDVTFDEKQIDHVIPVSDGGTDSIDNYALSCSFCNRAKWDMPLGAFLDWLYWVKKQNIFPAVDEFE